MKENKFQKQDIFYAIIISLVLIIIFSLGYFIANLNKLQKPPVVIEKNNNNVVEYTQNSEILQEGVVASINSDKYHYLHCSGAKRISEKNKIYFDSPQDAQNAGFVLAGNCN